ncbi:YitT family protein [Dorea amylophila]|uniref:YitT family protein n=1 Tax=Dorea amylophila TaxID=2981789 RepID=A0ABW8B0U4_9FIRM|nr:MULTISPECIES: YitT family protein [Dorea]
MNRLTGLSVSMFVLGFNIVMLVVGFIFLGKKFAFTTIVSTFTYPICLELFLL